MSTLPTTMRALRKSSPTPGYTLVEEKVPCPEGDDVLIKVEKVAICGSDIALYTWNEVAQVIATVPFIPGHEAMGTVVATGPEATVKVGAKVAVENHFYCGTCYTCKDGRGDICARMDQYGHGRGTEHGGFSEYSLVSSKYCYVFKTDITPLQGVLMEPLGVAHNGVESIDVAGHQVLVIGAGPIGLLAAQCATALGASKVILADINPARLSLARSMGDYVTIDTSKEDLAVRVGDLTDGCGVSRLVEASGAPSMVNSCFSLLRKGAKLVLIGLPKSAIHIENPLQNVIFKSITLTTVHGRRIFHTWEECERLISEKKVDPTVIVSHEFPMTRWQEAFDTLMSGSACKIVVDTQF